MPDLIVWQRCDGGGAGGDCSRDGCVEHSGSTDGGVYGEARLVEVKSPTDKLSDQQRAWIDRLAGRGVRIEVCRVVDSGHTEVEQLRPSFAPPLQVSQPPPAAVLPPDADEPEHESMGARPRVYHLPVVDGRPRGSRLKLKRKAERDVDAG